MSQQPVTNSPAPFDLTPGLLAYYSSQAEMMLAQYKNINHLLGRTNDWTHPGDLCEILLRDFLRKFLPPNLSVDKGFFYGRTTIDGKDIHCPEIDILIHDAQTYPPLFRMGDFVIIRPEAVVGMIQVKRTLSESTVRKGVQNVVRAKQHLLHMLCRDGRPVDWLDRLRTFSAVVGFRDEIGGDLDFYQRLLRKWSVKHPPVTRNERTSKLALLPSMIGSLEGNYLRLDMELGSNRNYAVCNSNNGTLNVFAQALLIEFYIWRHRNVETAPPFADHGQQPLDRFYVLNITSSVSNVDGTITLHRDDGSRLQYRKADGPTEGGAHYVWKEGKLEIAGMPPYAAEHSELRIQRGNTVDFFKLDRIDPPPKKPKRRRNP